MDKKWLALLVITAIIIAGCGKKEKTLTTNEVSPYIGGNKGLIAEFLDMGIFNEVSKTNEIFEGEGFPIEIMLNNKGEYNLAQGDVTIKIKGISLTDFSGIVGGGLLQNTEEIEKISEVNKEGGEDTLDFTPGDADATYLTALAGSSYDVDVFAEVEYNYKTFASVPKVCFKEDLTDDSICEVDEKKDVFSSAAPVQVTGAEEKRAGTAKIAIEFTLQNVGTGDVAPLDEDFNSRYDQLGFEVSDQDIWECKSGGKLGKARLDTEGKAIIICKLKDELPEGTLYTKQLDLTLSYKYQDLIQETVRILKQ